jgi:hypothetical protein
MTSLGLSTSDLRRVTLADRTAAIAARPAVARHVIAAVNGPGEVAAWLYPFAAALREQDPAARLSAALLPCVFASGAEPDVLSRMPGIDGVIPVRDTMRWILRGDQPAAVPSEPTTPGCVLHFGGEVWLSALLAWRLRYRLVIYSEDPVRYSVLAHRVCLADRHAVPAGGLGPASRIVGNLMVDAARMRVPQRRHRQGSSVRTIALFPGSRAYQVRNMLPFLIKVAGDVASLRNDVRWVVAQSEFVSDRDLAGYVTEDGSRVIEGESASLVKPVNGAVAIRSARGVNIEVSTAAEAMREADLALTIPGTNTAELAALGIPMLLLLPTHHLRGVPLPGLAGHARHVPVLGPWIAQLVAESYVRTRKFWAHPNRRASAPIVPEVIGKFTAAQIAARVNELLDGSLDSVATSLRMSMGPEGGANRLVSEVLDTIGSTAGR